MAVQAQLGGLAGCLLPYGVSGAGGLAEEQLQALLSAAAAAGNKQQAQQQYHCAAAAVPSAALSELTCNGGGVVASRKRGRDWDAGDLERQYHHHVPSAALLPIPAVAAATNVPSSSRMAESAAVSTSGRGGPLTTKATTVDALLAAELQQQSAEVDALVRAGCERLRAGLERARKRQCEALAHAAARALREKEAEVDAARRRAQELEERLRQAAAETQAWCGLARSHEATASSLRATLDALLLRAGAGGGVDAGCGSAAQHDGAEEGFGESGGAESCCFVDRAPASKWACRACGGAEASVLVLPCRHLCLCKACEPRADACPVCAGAKNAAIHIAAS